MIKFLKILTKNNKIFILFQIFYYRAIMIRKLTKIFSIFLIISNFLIFVRNYYYRLFFQKILLKNILKNISNKFFEIVVVSFKTILLFLLLSLFIFYVLLFNFFLISTTITIINFNNQFAIFTIEIFDYFNNNFLLIFIAILKFNFDYNY